MVSKHSTGSFKNSTIQSDYLKNHDGSTSSFNVPQVEITLGQIKQKQVVREPKRKKSFLQNINPTALIEGKKVIKTKVKNKDIEEVVEAKRAESKQKENRVHINIRPRVDLPKKSGRQCSSSMGRYELASKLKKCAQTRTNSACTMRQRNNTPILLKQSRVSNIQKLF